MASVLTEWMDTHLATVATQAGAGAVAGPLNGAKLFLSTVTFTPAVNTVPADLTAPTAGQWTAPVLTWGAAVRDSLGDVVTLSDLVPIQSADGTPMSVVGWAIEDAAGTHVLMCGLFDGPLSIEDALSYYGWQFPFCPAAPRSKDPIVTT